MKLAREKRGTRCGGEEEGKEFKTLEEREGKGE